jgi:hypothetical protein
MEQRRGTMIDDKGLVGCSRSGSSPCFDFFVGDEPASPRAGVIDEPRGRLKIGIHPLAVLKAVVDQPLAKPRPKHS